MPSPSWLCDRCTGRRRLLSPVMGTGLIALALSTTACSNDGQTATGPEPSSVGTDALPAAMGPDTWTSRRGMPKGRHHHGAGVVPNAAGEPIVYVLGGQVDGPNFEVPTDLVYAYNFSTDTWETRSARGGLSFSNGVGVIGGKVYQSGGISGTKALKTLTVYDPVADAFTVKTPMPSGSAMGVTGVIGGKLYVLTGAGGSCSCNPTKRLYRYDPASNTWTTLRSAPEPHIGGAAGVIGGKFYVAGGGTDKVHVYDPAKNRWKALAPLPALAVDLAGAVLNGKLYVVAGPEVWAYDPAQDRWEPKAPMNGWRHSLAAVSFVSRAGNPRMLAVGGVGDPGWPDERNEVYAP
jgi:hypothetical protein